MVAARVYAELLGYYRYRVQDEYVLVAQIDGDLAAIVNGRTVNPKLGMSLHTLALRRGLRVGAHCFAAKMEYHLDILGQDEVLIVAESPIGFRRWMIEYQLEKRFAVSARAGRGALVRPDPGPVRPGAEQPGGRAAAGAGEICWPRRRRRSCRPPTRPSRPPICWPPPGPCTTRPARRCCCSAAARNWRAAMREVYVVGIGITSFTRLEYPLAEIAAYPAMMALQRRRARRRSTTSTWPTWAAPASTTRRRWPARWWTP